MVQDWTVRACAESHGGCIALAADAARKLLLVPGGCFEVGDVVDDQVQAAECENPGRLKLTESVKC